MLYNSFKYLGGGGRQSQSSDIYNKRKNLEHLSLFILLGILHLLINVYTCLTHVLVSALLPGSTLFDIVHFDFNEIWKNIFIKALINFKEFYASINVKSV